MFVSTQQNGLYFTQFGKLHIFRGNSISLKDNIAWDHYHITDVLFKRKYLSYQIEFCSAGNFLVTQFSFKLKFSLFGRVEWEKEYKTIWIKWNEFDLNRNKSFRVVINSKTVTFVKENWWRKMSGVFNFCWWK